MNEFVTASESRTVTAHGIFNTIVLDDDYEIDDYNVKVYHHSGDVTNIYRKYMYDKFGNEYAKDYLFL